MRIIFLVLGIAFAVLGAIIAFQNSSTIAPVYFFLSTLNGSLFFPLALMFFAGIGSGFFWGLSLKSEPEEEDDF